MRHSWRDAAARAAIAVIVAVAVASLLSAAPAPASAPPASRAAKAAGAPRGASGITAAQLRDYLGFLASDDLEGRDTPSRGLDIAARFLATQLARIGAEPAGDEGSFFQKIALTSHRIDAATTTASLSDRSFTYGKDFLATPTAGTAEGPLVYVGHGYVVKAKNLDAYRGIDVAGKILVAHSGTPPGVTRRDRRGTSGEDFDTPITYAARHGAKGVIFIPSFDTLSRWDATAATATERGSITRDATSAPARAAEPSVPAITASAAMLDALFADEPIAARDIFRRAQASDPADAFALKTSKQVRFTIGTIAQPKTTQNVVAIVRGSDRVLKEEYVALGAHYDHVGLASVAANAPAAQDRIYNGADDDGSGTTALLAMAETIARLEPRPKRSVLFVWHAGEERGLWGSAHFVEHPTVPLDRIVAQLNVDMIGRSRAPDDSDQENALLTGPNEVYVVGSKMMSGALGELSERVNAAYLKLSFNYRYDDLADPSRLFTRSDHYNYARKGVPIIFYFSGFHADYHQPSDSIEKIDFVKMEKVTRTIYATALALAEASSRPRVDRALPSELTEQ